MTRARQDKVPVFCRHCTLEIEACRGVQGEWMHTASRYERCGEFGQGKLAEPETAGQVGMSNSGKRRRAS